MSPSCLLSYLGFREALPRLIHHTFFFDEDLDTHLQHLLRTDVGRYHPTPDLLRERDLENGLRGAPGGGPCERHGRSSVRARAGATTAERVRHGSAAGAAPRPRARPHAGARDAALRCGDVERLRIFLRSKRWVLWSCLRTSRSFSVVLCGFTL